MPTTIQPSNSTAPSDNVIQNANVNPQSVTEQIYVRNRELLQERRRIEELLYNVSEGVLAVNKNYEITIFNDVIGDMLSIPREIAMGKPLQELVHIETQNKEVIDISKYLFQENNEENSLAEVTLLGPQKNYFVNVKFSFIQSEGGEKDSECLITITDVTKEITLDKEKNEFISIASHELKSPLTVIKSYIWMLINKQVGDITAEQSRYLETAYKSTDHLVSLINDMLNISRMDQGRLIFNSKEQNIVACVSSVVAEYNIKAKEKNIYFKTDLTKITPNAVAYYDETKLQECLSNLISNAIKFTKEGGVTVLMENDNDFVKITVSDTGVGISENDSKDLFKKFVKGEDSYKKSEATGGTGLGLYIVKMYIEAMGGQVGYLSNGDFRGSTFWATVPKSVKLY